MTRDVVLSHSVERSLLASREAALQAIGYEVISATAAFQIRYEIEWGQCGVLILCYTVHESIHHDLSKLFAQHCADGVLVSITHPRHPVQVPRAHLCLGDSEFSQKAHLIRELHLTRTGRSKMA